VAVAQPAEQVTGRQLRAVTALAGELAGLGGVYDGRLVLAAAGESQSVARRLHDRLDGATVGVAATTEGIRGFPAAHRDARQTLEALLRLGRAGEVSDPAGLGLARILLGSNDGAALDEFIDRTLGPVVRYDSQRRTALVETLHAWSATGGALRETATRLHLHPNTVSQRLDRVDRLLGPQWRDPDRRLDVQLALQLLRLRRDM
jgi:DNA-binding PucR family transcriptional regulator